MTGYQQFPPAQDPYGYGPMPYAPTPSYAPAPPSRTLDIVATSMLIATHLGGYLLIAFFSMFWVMVSDSCGGTTTCTYDYLTYAYVLTDLVGGVVLLAASITAVVLMVRKKVAFWVPLVGILAQVVLLAISIGLLDNVVG